MSGDSEDPLKFPLRFPIKVMGADNDDFESFVVEIVKQHVPDFDDATVEKKNSRTGRFVSITVIFTAESRAQLDGLYRDLTARDEIAYVL